MGTKSRDAIYGASVRHSAEQAAEARRVADHLACVAWSQRMLAFQGPAQPSPTLGDALNGSRLVYSDAAIGQKVLPFGSELVEIVIAFDVIAGNQVYQVEQPIRTKVNAAVACYVDKN
jgi:hypothetical protein